MRTDGAVAHKRVARDGGRHAARTSPVAATRAAAAATACLPRPGGNTGCVLPPSRLACPAVLALLFAACASSSTAAAAARAEAEAAANAKILATLLARYDADRDGKVQQAEHPRGAQAFANLDRNGDGAFDADDFRVPTPDPMTVLAQRHTDPARLPKVGDLAPDFTLPLLGMPGTTVRLSALRGERPVALVFGSFT